MLQIISFHSFIFIVFLTILHKNVGNCAITLHDQTKDDLGNKDHNRESLKRVKRFQPDHPCSNHLTISNPNRRVSNLLGVNDTPISDHYLQPGWYRFKGPAGDIMPTRAPETDSCGTKWPIWFSGTHPEEVGEVIVGSACLNHRGIPCFRQWEIQVANCGEHYVYRLNNPPLYESAYCAGLERLCPPGTNSMNGFTPDCTDNFPALDGRVKLRVAHRNEYMAFNCDYQGRVPGNTELEVEWYVEGDKDTSPYTPVWKDRMVERKRSQLTRGRWTNKLGSTVYCKVMAKWRSGEGVPSHAIVSKKYFAGIKVMNDSLSVSEALEAGEIGIQSTVPVFCMAEYERICKIIVELEYDGDNEEHQQVVFGDCSVEITPDNWEKVHKIKVKAVRDFYDDGRKEKIIRFKKIYTTVASDIWNGYQIPDIKVYSSNGKTGLCTSHGDPHMLTFDKLLYHAYREGEFVLYESTKFPIKVHARMQKCATATCNCAVAVAVQDDVVVVDRCNRIPRNHASGTSFPNGWNTIHAHVLEQGGNFAKGLNIYEHDDGRKYTIHLPTGAYVQFEVMDQWVNIYIHASSDDFNATRGLCGTFDGVRTNDFRLPDGSHRSPLEGESCGHHADTCAFLSSWKVTDEDSLFKAKVNLNWGDAQILREESFCLCKKINDVDTISCDYQNDVYNSEARYERQHGKQLTEDVRIRAGSDGSTGARRRKRSISDGVEDTHVNDFADDYFKSQFVHNDSFQGELVELKPRRAAERLCVDAMNSQHMSPYTQLMTRSDLDLLLKSCTIDVQMTNSSKWIDMTLKQVIARGTNEMIKKRVNQQVIVALCPQACSNHGRCVNRTCHCHPGWTGSYCGVDLSAVPSDVRLANDGLCDNEVSQCDYINVFGKKFKSQDNITCIIKQLAGINDDSVIAEYQAKAKFMNFEQILIPLPEPPQDMQVFELALNVNDHFNFSHLHKYVVYSSKCLQCIVEDSKALCEDKDDTCLIDNMCFEAGEPHKEDCCLVCDPEKSVSAFIPRAWPDMETTRSSQLEMHDSVAYFDPPVPFSCGSNNIKVNSESGCGNLFETFYREEDGNELAFSTKAEHQMTCLFDIKVEDSCSTAERLFKVSVLFNGNNNQEIDECLDKPSDKETTQYWNVVSGSIQSKQVVSQYAHSEDSNFKIQLPRETREAVEYISISKTGLISYNVPEYEQMLPSITVVLTHHCGNVERFEIRFFDELE